MAKFIDVKVEFDGLDNMDYSLNVAHIMLVVSISDDKAGITLVTNESVVIQEGKASVMNKIHN